MIDLIKNTPLLSRRTFVAAGASAAAISLASRHAIADDDLLERALSPRMIGREDAPIQVAEYYSMTCGHCADFHNNTFPKVKAKLIDEGIVRFEMRPFPLDGLALRAHALVRAVPESKFFALVKMLLAKQPVWVRAADPVVMGVGDDGGDDRTASASGRGRVSRRVHKSALQKLESPLH